MRSNSAKGDPVRKAETLQGALFEGHDSNDLSSLCGLQWRFQIRPRVPPIHVGWGWMMGWGWGITSQVTLVSLEPGDHRLLTGLV